MPGNSWHWVVNRKRSNSPAVTLSLLEVDNEKQELLSVDVVPALEVPSSQGWPLAARAGPDVDNWLGKKTRRSLTHQTCFFVPKKPPGRNLSEAAKGVRNIVVLCQSHWCMTLDVYSFCD